MRAAPPPNRAAGVQGTMADLGTLVWEFILEYGYVAVFVLMFLESSWIATFLPSELVVTVAAAALARDAQSLALVIVASTLGALSGTLLVYAVARRGGRPLLDRYARRLRIDPAHLDRTERWFDRPSGEASVFLLRLVPLLRALVSVPAGLARMRLWKFLALSLAGTAIFNAALAYGAYAASTSPVVMARLAWLLDPWVALAWLAALVALLVLARAGLTAARSSVVRRGGD